MMNLIKLFHFCIVAKYESFTKAANELGVSQPTLSKSIHLLENELNTQLFEHLGNKIKLNDSGRFFLAKCKDILTLWDETKRELNNSTKNSTINISLCVASSYFTDLINIIESSQVSSNFIIQKNCIDKDKDIIISSRKSKNPLYENQKVLEEECHLVIPDQYFDQTAHQLQISISTIANLPMISLSSKNELRQSVDNYFSENNIKMNISYEVDNPSLYRDMINQKIGIALIPMKTWKIQNEQATIVPLEKPLKRSVYIQTLQSKQANPNIINITNSIVNFFSDLDTKFT